MIVIDASVVLAASVDDPSHGDWAVGVLQESGAAPHALPAEVANVLRRLESGGQVDRRTAAATLNDVIGADVELWPFAPFAKRVWELRGAVTAYDAWYVALAEALELPLATLDRRLATANGPRCEFVVPD
ncbi:type II toxin-antitoxin system VapC family toxin [Nocardioides dilutus]